MPATVESTNHSPQHRAFQTPETFADDVGQVIHEFIDNGIGGNDSHALSPFQYSASQLLDILTGSVGDANNEASLNETASHSDNHSQNQTLMIPENVHSSIDGGVDSAVEMDTGGCTNSTFPHDTGAVAKQSPRSEGPNSDDGDIPRLYSAEFLEQDFYFSEIRDEHIWTCD